MTCSHMCRGNTCVPPCPGDAGPCGLNISTFHGSLLLSVRPLIFLPIIFFLTLTMAEYYTQNSSFYSLPILLLYMASELSFKDCFLLSLNLCSHSHTQDGMRPNLSRLEGRCLGFPLCTLTRFFECPSLSIWDDFLSSFVLPPFNVLGIQSLPVLS